MLHLEAKSKSGLTSSLERALRSAEYSMLTSAVPPPVCRYVYLVVRVLLANGILDGVFFTRRVEKFGREDFQQTALFPIRWQGRATKKQLLFAEDTRTGTPGALSQSDQRS